MLNLLLMREACNSLKLLLMKCGTLFVAGCTITPMGTWVSIGPEEIVESIYAGPNSGRATVIAVNPFNQNDVWLGTATGGVWHSMNIDAPDYSWESIMDIPSPPSIGALLLEDCSAQRCATVWVGTGENNIRRDTYYGTGLLRLSWDVNANKYQIIRVGDTEERFKYGTIIDIKRLAGDLYIAVSKGKSASASTAIVTAPPPRDGYGVHRSGDDGVTWSNVGISPEAALPSDMEVHDDTLLVGFHGQGIYRLTFEDVWCPLGPAANVPDSCPSVADMLPDPSIAVFDHIEIAVARSNPSVLYAAYGQCSGSETLWCKTNPDAHASPEFFASLDGGASWSSRSNSQLIKTYSRYTHVLEVNPQFDDRVYYGGLDLWASPDSGNNFGKVIDSHKLHLDQQDLAFPVPTEPLLQYIATDGGFYLRDSRGGLGNTQTYPKNFGLNTVQFYSACTSDWAGTRLLMGGTQDNGTVLFNGSTIWEFVLGGDGGDCNIAADELLYGSLYEVNPRRATTSSPNYGDFDDFSEGIDESDPRLFFPPFVMHPINRHLYFGTNRLYQFESGDSHWTPVSPRFDDSLVVYPEIERRNAISAIGLARSNVNIVYVALYNGDVWRSIDSGPCATTACWTKVGGLGTNNGLPVGTPTSLDVDPYDSNVVYIAYSAFSDLPVVWRSIDGGESWESFDEGLPPGLPAKVIKVDPSRRNIIYLGTDQGIYRRNLYGNVHFTDVYTGLRLFTQWLPYLPESGIPRVPVYDIAIDDANSLIYAATHGSGMYMQAPEPLVYVVIVLDPSKPRQIYLFGHAFRRDQPSQCTLAFLGEDGQQIAQTVLDSRGGSLQLDASGRLVVVNEDRFGRSQMFSPCLEKHCLEDSMNVESVNLSYVRELRVTCGKQSATKALRIREAPTRDPKSTLLRVRKLYKTASGQFLVRPIPVGGERQKVDISRSEPISARIAATDSTEDVALKLVDGINRHGETSQAGYQAFVVSSSPSEKRKQPGEIEHESQPFIGLMNKTVNARQIFTAVRVPVGGVEDLAFDIESIGRYAASELFQVEVAFSTETNGANGGMVTFAQRTPTGICRTSIETTPGQSGSEIAAELYLTVMSMKPPGSDDCPARRNSYDLERSDNKIITSSALGLSLEIRDSGVGVSILPVAHDND